MTCTREQYLQAKQELEEYAAIELESKLLEERVKMMDCLIRGGGGGIPEGVPVSQPKEQSTKIAEVTDLRKKMYLVVANCDLKFLELTAKINMVKQVKYRYLLKAKYVYRRSYLQIAADQANPPFSYDYVIQLMRKAIEAYAIIHMKELR